MRTDQLFDGRKFFEAPLELNSVARTTLDSRWPDDFILAVRLSSSSAGDWSLMRWSMFSGLPPDARSEDVSKWLEGYGRVVDCRVMTGELAFTYW